MASRASAALLLALALPALAEAPERRNWFDDPFFQLSSAVADCPLPAGPFITEAERRVQAHHRAEKGTSCWLAGQCEKPNFHAEDAGIAAALRAAWPGRPELARDSTLWVTVQARVVYIEGCVAGPEAEVALEAFARGLPKVQQALAIVQTRPGQPVPYKRRDAAR